MWIQKGMPTTLSLQKLKQNNTSVSYMAFPWSVSLRNLPSSTLLWIIILSSKNISYTWGGIAKLEF